MSVDTQPQTKWNLTGWSLINLIRLQASWRAIIVSSPEEQIAHEANLTEVANTIRAKVQQMEEA